VRALGIDLGGTSIRVGVLDVATLERRAPPQLLAHQAVATEAGDGPEAILDRIAGLARAALAAAGPVDAVGLGAPGPLDLEHGRSVSMPNLPGWRDVAIVAELEARIERPVRLLNDGRATTLAEQRAGAGRGCSELACFALGTGVGGGVVVGGRLLLGKNGTVGELGHQTIDPNGPPCACGSRGCLEQYASGPAIASAGARPTAEEVIRAARGGDAAAAVVLERAGTMLGIGIANVALAIGPQRVVVGGGVAAAGELLLAPARAELVRRTRMMPAERIEVVAAELGPRAGVIGAALWGALGTGAGV
jgi:glucokinase